MRTPHHLLLLLVVFGLSSCDAETDRDGGPATMDAELVPRDAAADASPTRDASPSDAAPLDGGSLVGPCVMAPPEDHAYEVGVSAFGDNNYIEYLPGDLPILIAAPHGGMLTPENMPPDDGLARDSGSLETALLVRARFVELTGRAPHVILNHIARNRLNLARDTAEPNADVPEAVQAYNEFHGFIEDASAWVTEACGAGHYFDFHTKGGDGQPIDVGTGLTIERLSQSDAELESGIRGYYQYIGDRPGIPFAELIRGPTSLGGLLDAYDGVTARPSPREPTPIAPFFIGGVNPSRHSTGVIDATHLEMHFRYINAGEAQRQAFAIILTDVIITFMQTHYGFELDAR